MQERSAPPGDDPHDRELQELLRRVRQVELRAKKAMNSASTGAYHSRFKGRGMSFSESRAYAAGDDPRHVDWNATARRHTGVDGGGAELFVKQFVEERELTVLLLVDLSGSMRVGSRARLKRQVAAEAAALFALSALQNHDTVGLIACSDRIERLVRPRKGKGHVLRLLRDILAVKPEGKATDLTVGVEAAARLSRKKAIVLLISDWRLNASELSRLDKPLAALARQHDVVAIEVTDDVDDALPDVGLVSVADPESGATGVIDTSAARVRDAYLQKGRAQKAAVHALLSRRGVERVAISDRESATALVRFLRRRSRRAA